MATAVFNYGEEVDSNGTVTQQGTYGVQSSPKTSIPIIIENLRWLKDVAPQDILVNANVYTDTKVASLVNSAPATLDTLKELADALGDDAHFASTVTALIGTKAPQQSPTFTGTVGLPSTTSVGAVTPAELGWLHGVTSGIQGQLNLLSPKDNPVFTGTELKLVNTSLSSASISGTTGLYLGDSYSGVEMIQRSKTGVSQSSVLINCEFGYSTLYNSATFQYGGISFSTANTKRFVIDGSGNVGVKTTNPLNTFQIGRYDDSWNNNDLLIANSNGKIAINNSPTNAIIESSRALTLNSSTLQSVGICVPNPQATLHSAGTTILGMPINPSSLDAGLENGQGSISCYNNSSIVFRVRGSDGVVRQGTIALA